MGTTVFIPSFIFISLLFLTALIILWTHDTGTGYKLIYLLILALYTHELVTALSAELQPTTAIMTQFVPELSVLAITVMIAALYDELTHLTKKKLFWLANAILFLVLYVVLAITFIQTIYSVVVGVFIVYTAYHSSLWLYQAPDMIRFTMALLFPIALYFIHPSNDATFYTGFLIGLGLGFQLEHIKLRVKIARNWLRRMIALSIGIPITALLFWLVNEAITVQPLLFVVAVISGLWITWLAPIFFVKIKVYDCVHGHSLPFKSIR